MLYTVIKHDFKILFCFIWRHKQVIISAWQPVLSGQFQVNKLFLVLRKLLDCRWNTLKTLLNTYFTLVSFNKDLLVLVEIKKVIFFSKFYCVFYKQWLFNFYKHLFFYINKINITPCKVYCRLKNKLYLKSF